MSVNYKCKRNIIKKITVPYRFFGKETVPFSFQKTYPLVLNDHLVKQYISGLNWKD